KRVFGYLAPEQAGSLRKPVDGRSDLYSLGIIFYRLLTGRLPYEADDVNTLIYQHVATEPPEPSHVRAGIPEILDGICLKLMAKDPLDRYQSAAGLVADLDEYAKQVREGRSPIEFPIARKDRLTHLNFATKMVGREQELEQLRELLEKAQRGEGGICFIAGEAGVGKSRLVDELRSEALRTDSLFLGGKCPTERLTAPYHVFRQALEPLPGKIRMRNAEAQKRFAARVSEAVGEVGWEVLKVLPQAADLLGHPPALEELEPEKAKARFLLTVGNFVLSLGTPGAPLVLFLDDLQWADDAGLELFERLGEKAARHAVLIIASYRTEEGPSSRRAVESLNRLKSATPVLEITLQPLTLGDTQRLVKDILSDIEVSYAPLVEWLHSRTQGNPFFTLEMLRLLVDQGVIEFHDDGLRCDPGRLEHSDLPDNAVDIVLHRIHALSETERELLVHAAVVGRAVDARILSAVSEMPLEEVSAIIENAIQRQILMRELVGNERVHFIHDRVREAFLERADRQERSSLHRKIAQTLEELYAGRLDDVIYDLAYHYTKAKGDPEKVLTHNCRAGQAALDALGYRQAGTVYAAARGVLESIGETRTVRYLNVIEKLGTAYRLSGQLDDALAAIEIGEKLTEVLAPGRCVDFAVNKAQILFEKGLLDECVATLVRSLRRQGFYVHKTRFGLVVTLIAELVRRLFYTFLPAMFRNMVPCNDSTKITTLRHLSLLAHVAYFQGKTLLSLLFYCKSTNYGDRIGLCREHAELHAAGVGFWATLPSLVMAKYSHRQACDETRRLNSRRLEASVRAWYVPFAEAFNRSAEGLSQLGDADKILMTFGEYYYVAILRTVSVRLMAMCGDIRKGLAVAHSLLLLARDAHMRQAEGWALWNITLLQAFLGEVTEQTVAASETAHRLAKETTDIPNVSSSMALIGYAHLRRGEYRKAVACVEEAVALSTRPNAAFWVLRTYPIGAQIYLESIRSKACPPDERDVYMKRARWFCRMSLKWGRKFKYIWGWAWQVNGTWHWLAGHQRKARRCWRAGLSYLQKETQDIYRIAW
ncbi:MAG: AAA family ATPase, partial [bacterium]